MTHPTPDQQAIDEVMRQARSANARHLVRLWLDRLRAAAGSLEVGDYLETVEVLRDVEGDEAGARIVQLAKYPPDPAA